MTEATVWRILGNELLPRDYPGKRLDVLKYILEHEPELEGAQKWYVVNRLMDILWQRCICELLDRHNAKYVTIPFDRETLPNPADVKLRGINLNNARNAAVRYGHAMTPWSVILDGDCIFDEEGWQPVIEAIRADTHSYLSIPHCRAGTAVLGEPMLAFKRGATELFNDQIPFGDGDKLDLLFRLGHDRTPYNGHLQIHGNMTKLVGKTIHMPTGSDLAEQNLEDRENLRRDSIDWFCDRIANWPQMRLTVEKPLGRFWEGVDGYFDYSGLYSSIAFDVHDGARIVEVGSWQGKSIIYLANQFKAFGKRAHMHCVDTFDGGTDEVLKARIEQMGGSTELFKRFSDNIHNAGVHYMITPHVETSVEASKKFKDESVDVVFLDADHSYEAVKADLEAWYPKIKLGGLMAGHDFVFENEVSRNGVIRACLEFFADKPFEVMPNGRVWKSVAYKGGDSMFPDSANPGRRRRLWA